MRERAGTTFELKKQSASAAIATFFTLRVVEPMMVGMFGGGWMNFRLGDGRHVIVDDYPVAPLAAHSNLYRPVSDAWPDYMQTENRENVVGPPAVAVPGCLKGWFEALKQYGSLDPVDVMQPAIRHASNGFLITPYLSECIREAALDIARFSDTAEVLLPLGSPPNAGDRLVQSDLAETLSTIATEGAAALYGGAIGSMIVESIQKGGGIITLEDLK